METQVYYHKKSIHRNNEDSHPTKEKKMKVVANGPKKGSEKDREAYKPKSRTKNIEPHIHTLQQYSNYKWNELDINELYREFKQIEGHLKELVDVSLDT